MPVWELPIVVVSTITVASTITVSYSAEVGIAEKLNLSTFLTAVQSGFLLLMVPVEELDKKHYLAWLAFNLILT